jgi:hypothetical protein
MLLAACLLLAWIPAAGADESPLSRGLQAIRGMTGCFLVDYSYVEVENLEPAYVRDPRVYDVNRDKSAKEWITAEALGPDRIWLRRILFLANLDGTIRPGTEIRHQSEDWQYEARFLYDFVGPLRWQARDLTAERGRWTRRVTNLDDGPRYQCAATWSDDRAYPEWSCSNYAPIPGRETRDMGRRDYQALQRGTRIMIYGPAGGGSWLERQNNVKTIDRDGTRTPLVRELGKNWYVRLPDGECAGAQAFAAPRQAFWALLRETWDRVLDGSGPFTEHLPAGQPPRFVKMFALEEEALGKDLSDPATREQVRQRILEIIQEYRAP